MRAAFLPLKPDTRRFGGVRQKLSDWNVMVGAGVMYAPKFEGSDEFELVPIPLISATLGDRVTIDPGGLNVDVFDTNGFKVAVKGGFEMGGGRKESDSPHLRGLGNIDAGAVVGTQISQEMGPMEFYASVDKTIGGSESLLGQVGANVSITTIVSSSPRVLPRHSPMTIISGSCKPGEKPRQHLLKVAAARANPPASALPPAPRFGNKTSLNASVLSRF